MAKKKKEKDKTPSKIKTFFKEERTHLVIALLIFLVALYLLLAIVSFFFTGAADQSLLYDADKNLQYQFISSFSTIKSQIHNWTGARGAYLSELIINKGFGVSSLFAIFFFVVLGLRLINVRIMKLWKAFLWSSFGLIWFSLFFDFFFKDLMADSFIDLGGAHGFYMTEWLNFNFGVFGTFLILLATLIIFCLFAFENTLVFFKYLANKIFKRNAKTEIFEPENIDKKEEVPTETSWIITPEEDYTSTTKNDDFEVVVATDEEDTIEDTKPEDDFEAKDMEIIQVKEESYNTLEELGEYDPTLDLSLYRYPSVDLLKEYNAADAQVNMEEQTANKNKILSTLDSFGIKISTIKATVGPTITLYEIQPEAGVRISKIKNLEDDIALSLAALGIRIIAPIPGKGTIGIEVPNREPQTVSMRSVISSKKFQEAKYDLPVALGKTITNEVFMFDLCKMPHLLVAGATGQGKSVGLNAIITSLLYRKHPSQLKFVLIDPKKVEFNIYSEIERHFLAKLPDEEEPVITDVTKVVQTLNSLTKEMDMRYDLLKKAHARNIKEYNEKFTQRRLNPEKGHRYLPYIVVIVDEFGDLIMTAGKEVELPIARIAQLARAIGIHMIIATQRPSVSIITGVIKANFPARVAFRVSAMVDSRTILDASGANQLVGKGDLLFSQGSDLIRVQCAFVDTPEVEKIAEFIGHQQGYPTAFQLPEYVPEDAGGGADGFDSSKLDPMFEEAARFIISSQQGSTSSLQRRFEIGYNRAGRIMDQMEKMGIVSAAKGSKPRDVLYQSEMQLDAILPSGKSKD
jgi:S-DNA-T family DNA segregation ATPase FtsK/SpoIIIE